ncbi:hypothetical protein CABS01_16741 [Colletotrichum abscissum]|uniref:uncharacterized protein n=1 Tax=Colletotrichum abscissum TaxID=1671311 RepID=UPI0027D50C35|nr:uncharacterized protein CABS01_16741 [Colletotrichum abscissum]KAK1514261.1 hypothetical protein CABS01_16741 [Colletotrichum abscissum]
MDGRTVRIECEAGDAPCDRCQQRRWAEDVDGVLEQGAAEEAVSEGCVRAFEDDECRTAAARRALERDPPRLRNGGLRGSRAGGGLDGGGEGYRTGGAGDIRQEAARAVFRVLRVRAAAGDVRGVEENRGGGERYARTTGGCCLYAGQLLEMYGWGMVQAESGGIERVKRRMMGEEGLTLALVEKDE